ncbi:MAG TPA: helix-turn-helix domain-containing protein [Thermoplasmata archaeon]|nr:helix-turn-helix domain-containing protein [Thermoplasmata archaeon]
MMEAVIAVDIPDYWAKAVCGRFRVQAKLLGTRPQGKDSVRDLVEMVTPDENMAAVVEAIRAVKSVAEVDLSVLDQTKAVGSVTSKKLPAALVLAAADAFLVGGRNLEDGKIQWTLFISKNEVIKKLVEDLKAAGAGVELQKLSRLEERDALTARQEEILMTAFERGFFDYPKRIGLRELAKMFDISASTLSEILRKGQKKIIETYLSETRVRTEKK